MNDRADQVTEQAPSAGGERRTPFKGGALVGNVIEALANACWSAETGFYGDYQGPQTARFSSLAVAGGDV